MSPARSDLNHIVVPRFAKGFFKGQKILFVGVDPKWDYKGYFPEQEYMTMDNMYSRHPDILGDIQGCSKIEDESFDGVFMTGVYEYLPEPAKAISEIYRILKEDGKLLFCAPGIAYYGNRKPSITFRRIPDVLPQFQIKEVFISYYISKDPYYFHVTATK